VGGAASDTRLLAGSGAAIDRQAGALGGSSWCVRAFIFSTFTRQEHSFIVPLNGQLLAIMNCFNCQLLAIVNCFNGL